MLLSHARLVHWYADCVMQPPCIKENQYALGAASTNGDSPSIGFCIESLICGKYEGANQGSAESYWKWELRYL